MSFRARLRAQASNEPPLNRILFAPVSEIDAPIETFVHRVSHDNKRVHREQVNIEPPSPVKRQNEERQRLRDAQAAHGACDESFTFERYRIDLGDTFGDDGAPDASEWDPHVVKPFKPSDKSLSEWRPKVDIFASEYRARASDVGTAMEVPFIANRAPSHGTTKILSTAYIAGFTQASLGLRVQLGHQVSERCEAPERGHKDFVVLHTNGIHEVQVDFCGAGCKNAVQAGPPEVQLLRARWFPATHDKPRSCATIDLLDQFREATLQAKTTMYDAYRALERLTNNTGVKPPDRYHEWIRMCREHAYLELLIQAGRLVAYDSSGAAGTKSGECAVQCPACLRPGVNIDDDWENVPLEQQYKFTLDLGIDACFRLKRRLVSSELKDPGLGTGYAYMVENEPYREFLRTVTNQKEINSCSGLAALDYANTKFSRGYSSTGVGMCVCARHEFVQPNGVGDLQRGERFANMDYIFGSVMRHKHPRQHTLASYDIVCAWNKLLKERMAKMPALVRLDLTMKLLRFVIPKLHILGHKELCRLLYSLNITRGAGQLDGEGIERPWASIGGLASSTREMGPGARHGVLDAQWGSWNWQKLIDIVATLRRRMDSAKEEYTRQKEALDAFSAEQASFVPNWQARVDAFEQRQLELGADSVAGKADNPYAVKMKGKTEGDVRLKRSQVEAEDVRKGVPLLARRDPQQVYRVRLGSGGRATQTVFRKLQGTYTPTALQVLGELTLAEDAPVETMPLLLPSSLTVAQRATCGAGLAEIEEEMRDAQCGEALVRLRNQLYVKSRLLVHKGLHSRNQGANTRARGLVTRNEIKIRLHSEKYQMSWEALRRLSPTGNPGEVGWHQLKATDVQCLQDEEDLEKNAEKMERQRARRLKRKRELMEHGMLPAEADDEDADTMDVDAGPAQRGAENRRQLSWIWTVAGIGGVDADLEDALRIEWSKAYARTKRWGEEIEILAAEYDRVLASFDYEAARWDERVESVVMGLAWEEVDGAKAFARKQVSMFRDLRSRGETTWTEAKLGRGKKHRRAVAPMRDSEGLDREEEEAERERVQEEEEREREEEEELVQGDIANEEEFLMGGIGDDD
ncbi:hypothetical protein B0H16DRAFT_1736802 [Mycena metata]|uniref:CxC2-like cysteine cluster KDZ transposase-associated domain-containing protein n=1 Tax=Mycena metata TaxID=1033252 RepID=A0AAD7MMS1_9AGAR|nr:hypothetical protein B0H16DRAFT_1736802 [Mycena metata]